MNLITKELNILSISDIHLGHPKNKTQFIIENLNKFLNNDKALCNCDILFIVGDFFDNLLSLPSDDTRPIDIWIASLIKRCIKYDVILRVLEGTPSHDRQQSQRFVINNDIINTVYHKCADLKFVNTLSIEYLEKYDINILYIPDEWNHSVDTTFDQVRETLISKNLEYVDIAIMHGIFDYQMGDIIPAHLKHDSNKYLSIVKGLIFIGHIHKPSQFGRIFAQGSFDRLAHGEEEAKGYLSATLYDDYTYKVKFIENTSARKYITINCTSLDIDVNLNKIEKIVSKLLPNSNVRISAIADNPIISNQDVFKRRWPDINWSVHLKDRERKQEAMIYDNVSKFEVIILNKETIPKLLLQKLQDTQVPQNIIDVSKAYLDEVI